MMFAVYIGVASIALCLLLLWGLSKWSSRQAGQGPSVDIGQALRERLLARAEGRIDQAEFDRQQAALHASLLSAPASPRPATGKLVWAIPGGVLLLGMAVYFGFSGPGTVSAPDSMPATPSLSAGAGAPPANTKGGDLGTVVKRLADKMEADPKNGEGWLLLAKTYGELRRFAEADAAYEKAAALLPADATMLADWADTHVMAKDRKWDAAGRDIVKRALAVDPKHVKSLALAGSEAFDRADYKGAIAIWKRMKAAAQPDSMDSKLADANIAEAESMLSGKKPATPVLAGASGPVVAGVVTLSPKLRGQVSPSDTLFVAAKAPDGKGPPLAVWKYQGTDFPIEFRLDDSMAIIPGRTLSQHPEVIVTVRLSKTGSADLGKGDISGAPAKTKLGDTTMVLELNSINQ
uniref:TPR repeat n=1 Tax=Dechloromonas aromatica (strain RCB) TaxID=159087 RepID=Q479I0_DECAR